MVFDAVLHLPRPLRAKESANKMEGHVDPSRETGRGDHGPGVDPSLVTLRPDGRIDCQQLIECGVVRGRGVLVQEPRRGQNQSAGTDTRDQRATVGGIPQPP